MKKPRVYRTMSVKARLSAFERLVLSNTTFEGPLLHPVETPCWIWEGCRCNKGYGQMSVAGVSRRVHIVAWELATQRKVKRGYTLDHRCRVKACWRPSHMQHMTRARNTAKGNRDNPRSTEAARMANAARRALSSRPGNI